MPTTRGAYLLPLALLALAGLPGPVRAQPGADMPGIASEDVPEAPKAVRDSVVKIHTTFRSPSFERPWSKDAPQQATGSGFVINDEHILTNAHVVEHASQVFIQPNNTADRFRAEVVAIAQGMDLAIVRIIKDADREAFHAKHPALQFDDVLPPIGSTVQAIGYPVGGEQQSVTEGVVSRIEFTDYNAGASGLRIQVDAALNPGNSGGPVVLGDTVIGAVFSGIDSADNIGYIIPVEEIRLFLDDVADGKYDGKPRVKSIVGFQTCENPALRAFLGLSREQTGLVYAGAGEEEGDSNDDMPLERWDVLDRVGEYDIDNDGLVTLAPTLRVHWAYLIQKLGKDGTVPMTIIRKGQSMPVGLPVSTEDPSILVTLGDAYPEYLVYGPLVFTKAYRETLFNLWYGPTSPIRQRFLDDKDFDGEELVVVPSDLLPHPITKGYSVQGSPTLESVNGVKIKNLAHLVEVLNTLEDEYVEFRFADMTQEVLVFSREELEAAREELLEDNSIRSPISPSLAPLWTRD
jgi:Trypsin-like serine proteases, typically periplasmic, contain C-terminal PDZ domain